jgi:hypothetical protein
MSALLLHAHCPPSAGFPFGAVMVTASETAVAEQRLGDCVTVHSGGV